MHNQIDVRAGQVIVRGQPDRTARARFLRLDAFDLQTPDPR